MIQYPKNTHLTLPSVEAGLGSMNILRDPPKARYTYYKPKVGDTNQVLDWNAESDSRVCESIKKYARGVNPMVSVSYSNVGNGGGGLRMSGSARTGGRTNDQVRLNGNAQAYLPYRVMKDGAFRPPLRALDLEQPLSRLPRPPVSVFTNSNKKEMGNIDVSKLYCKGGRDPVKHDTLKVCIPSNKKFNIEKPYIVKNVDNNIKSIDKKIVNTNKKGSVSKTDINYNPAKGVRSFVNNYDFSSNKSRSFVGNSLSSHLGNLPMKTKNSLKKECSANLCKIGGEQIIPKEITLERNRNFGTLYTNKVDNRVSKDTTSRNITLPSKPSLGSFENKGLMLSMDRFEPKNNGIVSNTPISQLARRQQYSR